MRELKKLTIEQRLQKEIENNDRIIVGVNDFKSNDKQIAEIQKIDKDAINKQLNRLKEFKLLQLIMEYYTNLFLLNIFLSLHF